MTDMASLKQTAGGLANEKPRRSKFGPPEIQDLVTYSCYRGTQTTTQTKYERFL